MPTLSKRAASCLHFIFTGCHSSYDKLLDNINRPSLHIRSLVYRYFYGLAPSYINELLIETNSYNLHGKHSLSIPRVHLTERKCGLHSFPYSAFPSEILA